MSRIHNRQGSFLPKKISSRSILMSILLISVVVILIFLFAFRIIVIPDYILDFFTISDSKNENNINECEISDIKKQDSYEISYEKHYDNAFEVLCSLEESTIYNRVFRTITSSDGETYVERTSLTRNGECFRIENSYKLIIYNGEKIHIKEPSFILVENGEFSMHDEAGITPLSYIKERAGEFMVRYKEDDNKKIIVTVYDNFYNIYNEYEISVENGLVLTERSYYNNEVYRAVFTDKLEIMEHSAPEQDLFIIPEE